MCLHWSSGKCKNGTGELMHPMLQSLRTHLPEILSRKHIAAYFGEFISVKYLANLDYQNKGPKAFRFGGRKVMYYRDDFLNWMDTRLTELHPAE